MLVPYAGPPRCRRDPNPTAGLEDYLRRGGRIHPVAFGAIGDDSETAPLVSKLKPSGDSEAMMLLKASTQQAKITQVAVIVALVFAMVTFVGLGIVVWRVNDNMSLAEEAIRPHANAIVNATIDAMKDLGSSFHNVHEMSQYTNQLVQATAGATGPASRAVNSSAIIAQKLADFMSHPTLSISLGGEAGPHGRL